MSARNLFSLIFVLLFSFNTAAQPAREAAVPALPDGWRAERLQEPVFDSKILVVEAGLDNAETVLLVHGLGPNGFLDWRPVMEALQTQYHVLTLDLPGFGYSQAPAGRYSPANYAELLNWLVAQKAKSRVHLVGHSMGGAVALRFGAVHPERVKTAVLADVAGVLHRLAFVKHMARPSLPMDLLPDFLKKQAARFLELSDSLVELLDDIPDPAPYLKKNDLLWNLTMDGRPNMNAAYALIETDFSDELQRFTHPTTLIWGADDSVTPIRTARLLHGQLLNSDLHVIAGAGHVPMRSHTDRFNTILKQALSSPPDNTAARFPAEAGQQTLHCKNEVDRTYSGAYDRIEIENCTEITLRNVSANSVTVKNSLVHFENVSLNTDETACHIEHSVVVATNLACQGKYGLYAYNSRLDLAGADIRGRTAATRIEGRVDMIVSVSRVTAPAYSGSVHGTFELTGTPLEEVLDNDAGPAVRQQAYHSRSSAFLTD